MLEGMTYGSAWLIVHQLVSRSSGWMHPVGHTAWEDFPDCLHGGWITWFILANGMWAEEICAISGAGPREIQRQPPPSLLTGWLTGYKVSGEGLWVPDGSEAWGVMGPPDRGSLDSCIIKWEAATCTLWYEWALLQKSFVLLIVLNYWDLGLFVAAFSFTQLTVS